MVGPAITSARATQAPEVSECQSCRASGHAAAGSSTTVPTANICATTRSGDRRAMAGFERTR